MKKVTVATLIIGAFLVFSVVHSQTNGAAIVPKSSPDTTAQAITSPTSSAQAASTGGSDDTSDQATTAPTPTTATTPTTSSTAEAAGTSTSTSSGFKDGSYTGSVEDAQWGSVQVQAVITQGKITDVQFLEFPNDRSRSRYINSVADPELTNEAIQAQSAHVDIITGATDSSEAFVQSLANALSQAQS